MAAWVDHMRTTNPDPGIVPAVRLLDFYHGITSSGHARSALGWEKSLRVAPELAVGRLDDDLIAKYVKWQIDRHTENAL
jgi:hypothetical protein